MTTVLWLLAIQGVLGALDTIYYHEWCARLPARGRAAQTELKLHAMRDFIYAAIFATLPWLAWQGLWAAALTTLLLLEIVITLADFIIEDRVRKPLGGVYAGERAMHAIMGMVYGALLAHLLPALVDWWSAPTALVIRLPAAPQALRGVLLALAGGVFLSGVRDLCAVLRLPHSDHHWRISEPSKLGN